MGESELRLRQWIQAFGHEKQPAFISDLIDVLDRNAAMSIYLRTHDHRLHDAAMLAAKER